ncbi:MAG: M28 family metallopeptidase [Spirochaetota bacterium]
MNQSTLSLRRVRTRAGVGATRTFLALTLVLAALAGCRAPAASPDGVAIVTTIEALASPAYRGRLTGSAGNDAAVEFLAGRLAELGATPLPGADSLLHRYTQPVVRTGEVPRLKVAADAGPRTELLAGVDFDVLIREGTTIGGPLSAPIARLSAEQVNADRMRELRGHAFVVAAERFGEIASDGEIARLLFDPVAGPAAIVLVMPEQIESVPKSLFLTSDSYPPGGPVLMQVTAAAGRAIAAGALELTGGYRVEDAQVANVVGRIVAGESGEAPVILSAHLDGPGGAAGNEYYPGAIDNASGVAVVLEAARLITDAGAAARRPVWVALFNGEEQGLYGSKAFAADHGEALRGATVVNVDMVGTGGSPFSVSMTDDADELAARLVEALQAGRRAHASDAEVIEGGMSDHASFAGLAEAVSVVQAPYPAMHQLGDTPANADTATLAVVATAVTAVARAHAGMEQ